MTPKAWRIHLERRLAAVQSEGDELRARLQTNEADEAALRAVLAKATAVECAEKAGP